MSSDSRLERMVKFLRSLRAPTDRTRLGDRRHEQMNRAIPEIALLFLTVAVLLLIVLLAVRMT